MTRTDRPTDPEPTDDGESAALHDHSADGRPDERQEHAADRFLANQDAEEAERVSEHHQEMRKIGADVKGEGEIR